MTAFARVVTFALRMWPQHRLRELSDSLDLALQGWAVTWGLDLAGESTECAAAEQEVNPGDGEFLGRRGDCAAWLLDRGGCIRRIHLRLFAREPSAGTVAEEVATDCLRDLLAVLCASFGWQADGVPAMPGRCGQPWSGWVLASLPLGMRLLLSPEAVELQGRAAGVEDRAPLKPGARRLIPLGEALAPSPLRVHAELEGCEVRLGALRALQPGDVLRIRHRLDAPVIVRRTGGTALFSGFLVRRGERRALELAHHAIEEKQ